MRWTNWTGDQVCEPFEYAEPRSIDEVTELVGRARDAGRVVRVVGAGHSFTPAVLTDGTLISLDEMQQVLDIDRDAGLVRVEAGIRLSSLNTALAMNGLALENLGDIDVQSIAGATATGTHGTGAKLQNLSAGITALDLVTGAGEVVHIDASEQPDEWRAARVSLGALGVITSLTLRVVPAFTLRGVDAPTPLDDVLGDLDRFVEDNEHFEFYMFPHSEMAQTRTNNRVDQEPRPPSRFKSWLEDELLINGAFGVTRRIGRRFPSAIPTINRITAKAWGSSERVDRSFRIFASSRKVRFTEMEYAVPRRHALAAIREVKDIADRTALKVSFPIEVRFVAPDDAFLSPAGGRETCYIAVHVFEKMPWEHYFRAVEEAMNAFEGRPHWGKRHFQTHESLRTLYPDWDRFLDVRERFDPERMFSNTYVKQVLGS